MESIYIGKVVATHGIKGEIRIKSSFPQGKPAGKQRRGYRDYPQAVDTCGYQQSKENQRLRPFPETGF